MTGQRRSSRPLPPPAVPASIGGPAARPQVPADRFANPLAGPVPVVAPVPLEPAPARRSEPAGRVRKTYFYSESVAVALAEAVDRLHHGSHGRISKAAALDAIIQAGVDQIDMIEARLRNTT